MNTPPVDRMRARSRQLRRIADSAHDREMIAMLLKMAHEIDEDLQRIESGLDPMPPDPDQQSET